LGLGVLINIFLKKYLLGLLFKANLIYIYVLSVELHFILGILTLSSQIKILALLDCMAIDYPSRVSRFEILYSFWNIF